MLGFFKKSKKGNIEKEFSWLSLRRIASDLERSEQSHRDIAACLVRLSIYGGLNVRKTLGSRKLLKNADPDKIILEGSAFTWTRIYRNCLDSRKMDIYADDKLAASVYSCGSVLREILGSHADFKIEKGYLAPYLNLELIQATELFSQRLLAIGSVEMLGDIKDNIGVSIETTAFSTAMVPAFLDVSESIINRFLERCD